MFSVWFLFTERGITNIILLNTIFWGIIIEFIQAKKRMKMNKLV